MAFIRSIVRPARRFGIALTGLLALWSVSRTNACNVPVFRYALERWPASTYEAVVFSRGSLPAAEQRRVQQWQRSGEDLHANVTVTTVDLDKDHDKKQAQLWLAQSNAPLPWTVVRMPDSDTNTPPLWAGRLQDFNGLALIDSPARRSLRQMLLTGDSAVWVLLESGNAADDQAAAVLLTNELKRLESVLKLPPSAPDDPAPRSSLPLRIKFSVMRLSRNALGEDYFIRMLLHDEEVPAGKPVIVPVFGRGRALAALTGRDISAKVLSQAAAFLCGACSCEVKEMNPGKDLLLAANWEGTMSGPAAEERGSAGGQPVAIAPGNPTGPAAAPVNAPNPRRGLRLLASAGLGIAAIMILLVGIVLLRSLRQR